MPIVTIQERKWSAILMNKLNLIVEDFTGKRITILAQLEQERDIMENCSNSKQGF
jgi:hypothetical protein